MIDFLFSLLLFLCVGLGMIWWKLGISKSILLVIIFIFYSYYLFKNKYLPRPIGPLILILLIYGAITMAINEEGKWIYQFSIPYLCGLVYLVKNKINEKSLFKLFGVLVLINFFLVLLQYFYSPIFDSLFSYYLQETSMENSHFKSGRIGSIWQESPRAASIGAAFLPYFIYKLFKEKRIYFAILSIMCLVIVVLSVTRTAVFIVLIILIMFYRLSNLSKSLIIYLFIILLLTFYVFPMISGIDITVNFDRLTSQELVESEFQTATVEDTRIKLYGYMWLKTLDSPIFGYGQSYINLLPKGISSPHNAILQATLTYGYPYVFIFLLTFLTLLRKLLSLLLKHKSNLQFAAALSSLSIFLISLFHGILFDFQITLLFFLGLGLSFNQIIAHNASSNNLHQI